jgi:hypothetical protein
MRLACLPIAVSSLVFVVFFVASVAPVAAEPIAEGYELVKDQNHAWVVKGKRRAPIEISETFDPGGLKVDRKARSFTISVFTACGGDAELVFTFDQLEARLVNAEALVQHRQKDWPAAEKGFADAVRLDPKWRLPAYNLASARTLLGNQAGAITALAPWLASEPLVTYLQVAKDPELSPLLATKELAAIRGAKPGNVHVTAAGLTGKYGIVPDRGLVAVQVDEGSGMACGVETSIALIDATRGAVITTLPLSEQGRDCNEKSKPVEVAPKQAEKLEKLLVELGVVAATTPYEYQRAGLERPDGKTTIKLPKSKLGIVTGGMGVNVLRGNTTLATGPKSEARLTWGAFLPDAKLVLIGSYRPNDSCPQSGLDAIRVTP